MHRVNAGLQRWRKSAGHGQSGGVGVPPSGGPGCSLPLVLVTERFALLPFPSVFGGTALTAGSNGVGMSDMSNDLSPHENYDEENVPQYQLPEPLRFESGEPVESIDDWLCRRGEILTFFQTEVYGAVPSPLPFDVAVHEHRTPVYDGLGFRDQVRLRFRPMGDDGVGAEAEAFIDLLLYYPAAVTASSPAPVFVGLNFAGNHATTDDPAVRVTESWMKDKYKAPGSDDPASFRGRQSSRWPFRQALERGFAVATFYYGDVAPDHRDRWRDGIGRLLLPGGSGLPQGGEPGAISLWAWGLSRVLDYLEQRSEVNASAAIVAGHSRQGKTALWCAAEDTRFAAAISNCSGCGGSALSRRCFGETVTRINTNFPHWFNARFKAYNDREAHLPVDQHQLIALCAPRPVYVASATEDVHADPKGEFLSALGAEPVYQLHGLSGLGCDVPPPPDQPVGDHIRYHIRTGSHDMREWDWLQYFSFAEKYIGQ